MNVNRRPEFGGRDLHNIHIGGVHASARPTVVRTVLGSCIAVCLRDPVSRVGGMNHFLLPSCASSASSRYGVQAMELLINACMKAGADRSRLEAKMFGGGHVLRIQMSGGSVSERNVAFAHEFLAMEGIPLVKEDVGGVQAREIYYFTDNGRTLLKRVAPSAMRNVEELARSERAQLETLSRPLPPDEDSNVTLF